MRIAGREVLLPTTMVGNYPNPRWYDGRPFARYPGGAGIDPVAREAFEDAVLAIVHDQERAGLDVIADGRVYGGDSSYAQILYHYVERLDGYACYGPDVTVGRNHLYAPSCVGPISLRSSLHLDTLIPLRRATTKPVKVSYTGLQALALFSHDEHYGDTRKLAAALADAFHEDFLRLVDSGVDIIQIDEFVWGHGVSEWEIELLNRAVRGVGCQFWVHVCWGQTTRPRPLLHSGEERGFKRYVLQPDVDSDSGGRAAALWPAVLDADIHALNYEIGDFHDVTALGGRLQHDFVAGVIDVRSTEVETAAEVAERIRAVLAVVPPERLGLTTNCGLVQLPRVIAAAKLRALTEGAVIVRDELTGGSGAA